MQTVPYSDVIETIGALVGSNLNTIEKRRIKYFINRRAKKAFEESNYWPRFLAVGELRSVDANSRMGSGISVDAFLRVHAQKPFHNCDAGEYQFYVDTTGANIAAYRSNSIEVGTINRVQTISGIAVLSVTSPSSFWRSFLTENGGLFTFTDISGTPVDAAINGTHACTIDNPSPFAVDIQFIPDPAQGQPAFYAINTIAPDGNGLLYLFGVINGKSGFSNTGLGPFDFPPDGQSNYCYWDGVNWTFVIYSVTGGIPTLLGGWSSPENVATPDLVTNWTPYSTEDGNPAFQPQMIIPDSATAVNGKVYAQGAYVTYKRTLTDKYGDDSSADENGFIPREWSEYIIQGAYADWLRAEGQQDKALAEESAAEDRLTFELQKISDQHIGETVANRILTTGNTQQRTF